MDASIDAVDNVLLRVFDSPRFCLSSSPSIIVMSLRFDFLVIRADVVSLFPFIFFVLDALSSFWPLPLCLKSLTTCRNPLSNGILIVHRSLTFTFSSSNSSSTLLHISIVFPPSPSPFSDWSSRPTPTSRYTSGLPSLTFSANSPLAGAANFTISLLRMSAYLGRGVVVVVVWAEVSAEIVVWKPWTARRVRIVDAIVMLLRARACAWDVSRDI